MTNSTNVKSWPEGSREAKLLMLIKNDLAQATRQVEIFKRRLADADDPFWALEQADDAIMAAATVRVCASVVAMLTDPAGAADFDGVRRHAVSRTMRGALSVKRSTNVIANFADTAQTSAWADLVQTTAMVTSYTVVDKEP